ncbi:MAG: DNA polymerase III subunit alpha [Bacteroidales bacterium]|nr:DNA polymerase III subunit alpha [Bacteroidales bacterium]
MSAFVHLHLHSIYSVLDGACDIKRLLNRAKELKMPAVALTDHGNMYGILEFFLHAKEYGIKPILGVETYVARKSIYDKITREDRSGFHLILLAKNYTGYQNLSQLITIANLEGFHYTPRIDKELLEKYHEGIIATSACLGGEIAWSILHKGEDEAMRVATEYKDLFQDDFYLELMDHGLSDQQTVNRAILNISKKLNIKVIATNDVHYIFKDDFNAHSALIKINTNREDDEQLQYTGQEYLKTYEEMYELFKDIPEALKNTLEIAEKVEDYSILHEVQLPEFPRPSSFKSDDEYLDYLTWKGARNKYQHLSPEIEERIQFELDIIKKMGFAGYFLIVQDFITYARSNGILVGPGRGSAAGSIVAYCLGITNIDPLKYKLLFERFLNVERISMPDIDVDFDDVGRDDVIRYVAEKYGHDKVCQIVTFNKLAARSSIRDVGRILKLEQSIINQVAKLVPSIPNATIDMAFQNKDFVDLYEKDERIKKMVDIARVLTGNVRGTGVHACGVIIGREPIWKFAPLARSKESILPVVQYEGSIIEKVGLLKMDFLGLKTLTIIKRTLEIIHEKYHQQIDIDKISFDDQLTWQLFQRGETIGVFQFESDGMRSWLRELKPTQMEDLIAMNALYRPGPMNYIQTYINRKHGKEKVVYPHPFAKEILEDTYGIMVYQEQIMLLSQKMAGFSKGKADELRKAMGKKKKDIIEHLEKDFIEGCKQNGISEDIARTVYQDMAKFGEYGFNRSHATVYSVLAYQTAYLKAHYPEAFMASLLDQNLTDSDSMIKYLSEAQRMGITVLGPDVNESDLGFTVVREKTIRYGLKALKNVGEAAAMAIIQERNEHGKFTSLVNFFKRVSKLVNKRTIESLVLTGCLDNFGAHRAQFFYQSSSNEPTLLEKLMKYGQKQTESTLSLFDTVDEHSTEDIQLPLCPSWSKEEILKKEFEVAGYYISGHPLDEYASFIHSWVEYPLKYLSENIEDIEIGKLLIIMGLVTQVQKRFDKNGASYLSFSLSDFSGQYNFRLFKEKMESFQHLVREDAKLLIIASIENNRQGHDLQILHISTIDEFIQFGIKKVIYHIPLSRARRSLADQMLNILKEYQGNIEWGIFVYDDEWKKGIGTYLSTYKISFKGMEEFKKMDWAQKCEIYTLALSKPIEINTQTKPNMSEFEDENSE